MFLDHRMPLFLGRGSFSAHRAPAQRDPPQPEQPNDCSAHGWWDHLQRKHERPQREEEQAEPASEQQQTTIGTSRTCGHEARCRAENGRAQRDRRDDQRRASDREPYTTQNACAERCEGEDTTDPDEPPCPPPRERDEPEAAQDQRRGARYSVQQI